MKVGTLSTYLYLDESSPSGLRWKVSTNRRIKVGCMAGTLGNHGYQQVTLLGNTILAHRIVAVLIGALGATSSTLEVDHIDGNKLNNLPVNLRVVTIRQNANNRVNHRAGRLCGAHRSGTRWMSRITVSGRSIYLGLFDTEQAAHAAYLDYRKYYNLV